MPSIKWGASKYWYEVGWRPYPNDRDPQPFSTQQINPPQTRFVVPSPMMNTRYQYYIKSVNQQPGGSTCFIESTMSVIYVISRYG